MIVCDFQKIASLLLMYIYIHIHSFVTVGKMENIYPHNELYKLLVFMKRFSTLLLYVVC